MVVWQGITEGGTAVPVQITEEGKVVAIGETGPTGPTGPPGPPGQAEWPPNPIEGAFLIWLNGEPTWYAEKPIPIPANLIGPIVDIPSEGAYTVASEISEEFFFQGRNVVTADSSGNPTFKNWNQSQVWSDKPLNVDYPTRGFDGSIDTFTYGANNQPSRFTFAPPLVVTEGFKLYNDCEGTWTAHTTNGGAQVGSVETFLNPSVPSVMTCSGTIEYIEYKAKNGSTMKLFKVEADGAVLVNPGINPGLKGEGQVASVFNTTVVLTRTAGEIGIGDYLLANATTMASWLVTKRGMKI